MLHIRDRWFCSKGVLLSTIILRVLSIYLSIKISTEQMTVLSLLLNKGR